MPTTDFLETVRESCLNSGVDLECLLLDVTKWHDRAYRKNLRYCSLRTAQSLMILSRDLSKDNWEIEGELKVMIVDIDRLLGIPDDEPKTLETIVMPYVD